MIHPSYVEMIDKINADNVDREEAPLITSRYSIVLATAKRARQLVNGVEPFAEPLDKNGKPRKPLSVAVDEFYEDKVHIVNRSNSEEEAEETEAAEETAEETEAPEEAADEPASDEAAAETEE